MGGFFMNEFGSDYITIVDEEGNEFELELLDTLEYNNEIYMSFLPADINIDEENPEMIILKVIEENGEEILSTLDSDEELNEVYEKFMEQLFDDDPDDEEANDA
ncbi:MAG TPA: DUF1292 domain-containing protein [Clostridiales bacterium]|jgi:uncharacterized protein YrzB (UPF0473 family)|nr:DUF1292 domain-containing protein [Clostridiales bacterium]